MRNAGTQEKTDPRTSWFPVFLIVRILATRISAPRQGVRKDRIKWHAAVTYHDADSSFGLSDS
jgi:hypothetical protein